MRRIISLILSLAMVTCILAGCGSQGNTGSEGSAPENTEAPEASGTPEASEPSEGSGDEIVIGYNAYGDVSEFSQEITRGITQFAEEAGYKVLRADTGGDATKAVQNVDTFLLQGANVIVDCSWDTTACEAVADKCSENDVLCIILDIYVENEDAYYVGVDNNAVGLSTGNGAAEWINANWDGELEYVLIAFNESFGEGVRPRVGKIADGLAEQGISVEADNIVWVDPASSDAAATCKQLGTDFLTAHPDAKKILMCGANDEMAQGLLAAAETANRTDQCAVVSNDLTSIGIANIYSDNSWIGSTGFFPEYYGNTVMQVIGQITAGEELPHEINTDIMFMTPDNISEYYDNPNE